MNILSICCNWNSLWTLLQAYRCGSTCLQVVHSTDFHFLTLLPSLFCFKRRKIKPNSIFWVLFLSVLCSLRPDSRALSASERPSIPIWNVILPFSTPPLFLRQMWNLRLDLSVRLSHWVNLVQSVIELLDYQGTRWAYGRCLEVNLSQAVFLMEFKPLSIENVSIVLFFNALLVVFTWCWLVWNSLTILRQTQRPYPHRGLQASARGFTVRSKRAVSFLLPRGAPSSRSKVRFITQTRRKLL